MFSCFEYIKLQSKYSVRIRSLISNDHFKIPFGGLNQTWLKTGNILMNFFPVVTLNYTFFQHHFDHNMEKILTLRIYIFNCHFLIFSPQIRQTICKLLLKVSSMSAWKSVKEVAYFCFSSRSEFGAFGPNIYP